VLVALFRRPPAPDAAASAGVAAARAYSAAVRCFLVRLSPLAAAVAGDADDAARLAWAVHAAAARAGELGPATAPARAQARVARGSGYYAEGLGPIALVDRFGSLIGAPLPVPPTVAADAPVHVHASPAAAVAAAAAARAPVTGAFTELELDTTLRAVMEAVDDGGAGATGWGSTADTHATVGAAVDADSGRTVSERAAGAAQPPSNAGTGTAADASSGTAASAARGASETDELGEAGDGNGDYDDDSPDDDGDYDAGGRFRGRSPGFFSRFLEFASFDIGLTVAFYLVILLLRTACAAAGLRGRRRVDGGADEGAAADAGVGAGAVAGAGADDPDLDVEGRRAQQEAEALVDARERAARDGGGVGASDGDGQQDVDVYEEGEMELVASVFLDRERDD
jgi:hypothetical protein